MHRVRLLLAAIPLARSASPPPATRHPRPDPPTLRSRSPRAPPRSRSARPLTYAIKAENRGPDPATGVTVTDPLPKGVDYVSSTTTAGQCGLQGQEVVCAVGNLAVGAGADISLAVIPRREVLDRPTPPRSRATREIRPAPTTTRPARCGSSPWRNRRPVAASPPASSAPPAPISSSAPRGATSSPASAAATRSRRSPGVTSSAPAPGATWSRPEPEPTGSSGNAGGDRLFGRGGPDVLRGGRGMDRCRGGAGSDSIRGCER